MDDLLSEESSEKQGLSFLRRGEMMEQRKMETGA